MRVAGVGLVHRNCLVLKVCILLGVHQCLGYADGGGWWLVEAIFWRNGVVMAIANATHIPVVVGADAVEETFIVDIEYP